MFNPYPSSIEDFSELETHIECLQLQSPDNIKFDH